MKNRLSLTVGTLFLGCVCSIKAGMTWEEWTPENGIVDGQAALQEMLEAGKMPDENWQEKALAFINAFEKLKLQLQFFWRSQVGDGAIDGVPWNGISDGCKWYKASGFFRYDCPIVLHFWADNHIGKCFIKGVGNFCYAMDYCTPKIAMFSNKDFKKTKGFLKKYILELFDKKDLKICAIFLNQNFCKQVSNLILKAVDFLSQQKCFTKKELGILFELYSSYVSMDQKFPIVLQENYNQTTDKVSQFVVDCCYDMSKLDLECKKWVIDLFKNYDKNPFVEKNSLGYYYLDLTMIIQKFVSKINMDPVNLDIEFVRVFNVVADNWRQRFEKVNKQDEIQQQLKVFYKAMDALYACLH